MALIDDTRLLRELDRRFLERYDLAGPRYTSYPTAPEWTADIDADALRDHLDSVRTESAGKPLSIYLHFPFCIEHCKFCACNVIATPKMEEVSDPYIERLEREAGLFAERIDPDRPVVQFHWGGGTPTYLNSDQLRRAHAAIASRFHLAPDAEQSIEVHVTWTRDEQLRTLAELGFNRLSMGVQDFNERTMEAIGRRQTEEQTRRVVDLARDLGFRGINVDLIYGLPYQSVQTFGDSIDRVIAIRPDRLAVYNFAFLPGRMAHQRGIDPESLPKGEEKFLILLEAHDRLTAAGYRHIGMDHFALPDDELNRARDEGTMQRNFMGFTTRAGADLVAMGVTAISTVAGLYAQNFRRLNDWGRAIDAGRFATTRGIRLSADDLLRRDLIGALMCGDRVEKQVIERAHGIDFDAYFAPELERLAPMVRDGLLAIDPDALELSFLGRMFVRNIAMVFDAYLNDPQKKKVQYSRTL